MFERGNSKDTQTDLKITNERLDVSVLATDEFETRLLFLISMDN